MENENYLIEQDCSLCEQTFESNTNREICYTCENINIKIKPTTIKLSELANKMGIPFTKL